VKSTRKAVAIKTRPKPAKAPLAAAPAPPQQSALLTSLRRDVDKLIGYYREEAGSSESRAALQAQIDSGEIKPAEFVREELMKTLPPTLLISCGMRPQMEKALSRLVAEMIVAAGGPVDALIGIGQSEVEDFVRRVKG
jgi:hypothetical protein